MATATPQDMPLQQELGLVNYMRQLTGTQTNPIQQAQAGQASEIDSEGLQGIMTEWLRGSGQFLQHMQQQNQSGLYNSSTRRLVANDLTAQAALKAATAQSAVSVKNAEMQTQASIANANNSAKVGGKTSQKDSALNAILAAGIAAYNKNSSTDPKKDKKRAQEIADATSRDIAGAPVAFDASPTAADDSLFGSDIAQNYSNYPDYSGAVTPEYSNVDFSNSGADFSGVDFSGMDFFGGDTGSFDYSGAGFSTPEYDYGYQDYSSMVTPDYTPYDYTQNDSSDLGDFWW